MFTIKEFRSWSKPDNVPGLIGRKKVDWSIFEYGSHIPLIFHEDFENANQGIQIDMGKSEKIELLISDKIFEANLVNIDRKAVEYDTLQIRYDTNKELKDFLREKFQTSYNYLKKLRDQDEENSRKQHVVPDEIAEYIEFYETDEPFKYKLRLITAKNNIKRNVWWVNQGKTLQAELKESIIWAPIESSSGRSIYNWDTLAEVEKDDIILHYANGALRYVSKVITPAIISPIPESIDNGDWSDTGRLIKLEYYELEPVISLEKFNEELKNLNIEKGPINVKGEANQGYLFRFNEKGLKIIQKSQPETIWPDFAIVEDVEDTVVEYNAREILENIKKYIKSNGFIYPDGLIENFYLSLKTKPFVLLAGISGTGKTRLVRLFAEALKCKYKLVSVRPDWSDGSDLLGYKNIQGKFVPGAVIDYIKKANENPDEIYFLCLDEMNLARVEYYFSDFLSKMETRRREGVEFVTDKLLDSDTFEYEDDREKYGDIIIPENLYIVGTVNMDETTHPFSKKVLDRANTIEFNEVYLDNFLFSDDVDTVLDALPFKVNNDFLKAQYLTLNDCIEGNEELLKDIIDKLVEINNILQEANLQVGYRVRDELCFYMLYNQREGLLDENIAFDFQLMQKILPRIQGSGEAIKKVLVNLFKFTTGRDYSGEDGDIGEKAMEYVKANSDLLYPRSATKLAYMIQRYEEEGFTSYWL